MKNLKVSKSKDHPPLEPISNNTIGSPHSIQATSQSTDSCLSSAPSSSSKFSVIIDHSASASNENSVPEDEFPISLDAYTGDSFWWEPYVADIPYVHSEMLVAEPECLVR